MINIGLPCKWYKRHVYTTYYAEIYRIITIQLYRIVQNY